MAFRSITSALGSSATPSVAVPSGVASGDIVHLIVTIDSTTAAFSGKFPAGFTMHHDVNCTAEGQSTATAWKRTSGADTGTYDLTNVGASADWAITAIAHSGRHASNPPVASTPNILDTPAANPLTVTATGVTALADDDLIFFSAPDVTSGPHIVLGQSPPTDFTERADLGIDGSAETNSWAKLQVATRDAVSAGATGDIAGTCNLTGASAGYVAGLIRIPLASVTGSMSFSGPLGSKLLRGRLG